MANQTTFVPRHKTCGAAVGHREFSVREIIRKFDDDEYPDVCSRCQESIEDFNDLDIGRIPAGS